MIERSKSPLARIKEFYIDIDVLIRINFSYIDTIFTLITISRIILRNIYAEIMLNLNITTVEKLIYNNKIFARDESINSHISSFLSERRLICIHVDSIFGKLRHCNIQSVPNVQAVI